MVSLLLFEKHMYKKKVTKQIFLGVSHGDDSFYILNSSYINAEGTPQDRQMIHRMSNIWASFAITG
jgi:hypothetical protein